MNTNDPVEEKSILVIGGLEYAHSHELNINNIDDVKKILEAIDAKDENPEEFMELLQNADAFMEMKAAEKQPKKADLSN